MPFFSCPLKTFPHASHWLVLPSVNKYRPQKKDSLPGACVLTAVVIYKGLPLVSYISIFWPFSDYGLYFHYVLIPPHSTSI